MRKVLLPFFILFLPSSIFSSNYYWVGGNGTWSDYANHWATTSGGLVFHIQEPTPFDNVIFDVNSFPSANDSLYVDTTLFTCRDMIWSGVKNKPTFFGYPSSNGSLEIYGSMALDTAMIWNYQGGLTFKSTTSGKTITTASQTLASLLFDGIGGSWTLQDSLTTSAIGISNGDFFSNNQKINCSTFSGYTVGSASAHPGTSVINCNNWDIISPFIIDADSTIINCGGFNGGNTAYHIVNFAYGGYMYDSNTFDCVTSGGSLSITGSNTFGKCTVNGDLFISYNNTFDTLYFNNPGGTITLGAGSTQTIVDTISAFGTCTGLTLLKSSNAGVQATITKASGSAVVDYILMQDINASGGANFTANNSVKISNVTGWTVISPAPQNLYWVGGNGNWNDPAHWVTSSGGAGGSCIPTPFDNVHFDANSFTPLGDSVYFNVANGYCHHMDWTGATNNPVFLAMSNNILNIYGSLTFINSMSVGNWWWGGSISFYFQSTTLGETITSASQPLAAVTFDGIGGSWTLQDSLTTSAIGISNGDFFSNNQKINCSTFSGYTAGSASAHLGTSVINCNSWGITPPFNIDADSTIINGSGFSGGNAVYHIVNFAYGGYMYDNNTFDCVTSGASLSITGSNTFGKCTVNGDLFISYNNAFDTLYFNNPGGTITLGAGSTQTIVDTISAFGTCTGLTLLKSNSAGNQAMITKASGSVVLDYILMQDINASGGANFTANNSVAISNVTDGQYFLPLHKIYTG